MFGNSAPKHPLEIKWFFLEFAQILTQQYPAYFLDTLFGAEQADSVQIGLLKHESCRIKELVSFLSCVVLCWAEGVTT